MPRLKDNYKRKGTKPATEVARQLFLYGEGDGIRILDNRTLAEKSGLHPETLRKWLPKWTEEFEEKLKGTSKIGSVNALSLPDEVFEHHKADNEFIRKRLDKAKFELEQLPQIIENLSLIVTQASTDPEKIDIMMAMLDKYIRFSMNEKSLTKLFMDLKNLWDSKVGLDSLKAIQESVAKAQAKSATAEDKPVEAKPEVGVFKLG